MTAYILRRLGRWCPLSRGSSCCVPASSSISGDPVADLRARWRARSRSRHPRELGLDSPWYAQLGILGATHQLRFRARAGYPRAGVVRFLIGTSDADLHAPDPAGRGGACHSTAMLLRTYRGTLLDRTVMAICVARCPISFLVYIIVGQYVARLPARLSPCRLERRFWRISSTTRRSRSCWRRWSPGATNAALSLVLLDETKNDYVRYGRAIGSVRARDPAQARAAQCAVPV